MYLIKTLKFVLCIILFASALISHAGQNDPLKIIDLNNRPAEEMIPVIRPLLKPDDAITGTGYQLFIRTDKTTFDEVSRLLQVMDKAPRNLVISIRNNQNIGTEATNFDLSTNTEIGDDARVVVGNEPPPNGTRLRINKNERAEQNDSLHMVRVMEGGKAYITAGEIRPYEHRTIVRHRFGVSVYDNVDYQDITSGFYVTPQLTGNGNVTLQVQPHYRSANPEHRGSIDIQEANTTVTTKLGEWVQIGGVDTDISSREKGIISTSRSATDTQSSIYIKVDLEN